MDVSGGTTSQRHLPYELRQEIGLTKLPASIPPYFR